MKYLFISFAILIFSSFIQPLHAQKKNKKDETESFYLFKNDWSGASDLASADYFMQVVKINDSVYICRYYNKNGPMVKQESFKDGKFTIPNGLFCWYNNNGYLDSMGWVKNGHKDGRWTYYRNDKTYLSLVYEDRKMVEKKDYDADIYIDSSGVQFSLKEKSIKDSLQRDSLMLAKDSTKPVQEAAKFKGKWVNYISNNLKIPERLQNVLGSGQYVVIISFLIDINGNIGDVYLVKSCEWSADAEVFRLFKDAPRWIPAQQNGKPVLYRQKQALTFVVN